MCRPNAVLCEIETPNRENDSWLMCSFQNKNNFTMKENQRKCFKCGRSPVDDPNVMLYRFPRPGTTNTIRCESWAKYCFPDKACTTEFQRKLYSEHRMLCDHHFKVSSFIDFTRKILNRSAVPEDVKRVVVHVPCVSQVTTGPLRPALVELTNNKEEESTTPNQQKSRNVEPQPRSSHVRELQPGPSHVCEPQPGPSHIQEPQPGSSVVCEPQQGTHHIIEPQPGPSHVCVRTGVAKVQCEENSKQKLLLIKCRKNMQRVCQLRNRIRKLKNKVILQALDTDNAVNILQKKLSPTLALFLQGEIKNFKRKEKGRRWTKDQKITALRLYKRSPTCYHLLRRLMILPSPSSLKKILSQFPLKVGINKKIFTILKKFTRTQESHNNEYILLFDEMSIRKHLQYNKKLDLIEGHQDHGNQGRSPQEASHALVFMICGIRKKLKQPVAFYLSGSSVTADRLAVLIKEVLYHCLEANVNVSGMTCDMDGVNRRALGILGATSQNPTIEIFNHKIVSFFDPPHLLKCFRNLFMKYDVKHVANVSSADKSGTGIAKWSHIQQFFDLDSANANFVFAPALRQEHLTPNTKQKMRVKLAAQVLSHSVAAGMYCKISQGELTTEATVTANLISNMDKLFDCLNSDTPDLRRGKPYATNMTEKTPHLQIFREMRSLFQSLELIGCRTKPPSVEGWVWTLNAVEIFWRLVKKRHPTVRSLSTRRLQQDPIENLFGCIRGHCGSNTNPTASQFVAGLKTALLSSLATAGVRGTNCENDDNETILNNLKALLSPEQVSESIDPGPSCSADEVPTDLFNQYIPNNFDKEEISGEIQACAYVCGFILKKYNNDCATCKRSLTTESCELQHMFVNMKEYNNLKTCLNYASIKLVQTVELIATIINNYLEKNSHKDNLKSKIMEILKPINFSFLECTEHKDKIIKSLTENTFHICVKRFCIIKNRKFVEEASASALRKKINILKHN